MHSGNEVAEPAPHSQAGPHLEQSSVAALAFGAIGVVFGDIGTSPLYTMKETFAGPHPLALDRLHVLGVLSLIFWAVTQGNRLNGDEMPPGEEGCLRPGWR
jgi:KUP system potassium uptake protein